MEANVYIQQFPRYQQISVQYWSTDILMSTDHFGMFCI